jgi:MarR family transcriptional regulator, organic hydroperoxide resistance regulator
MVPDPTVSDPMRTSGVDKCRYNEYHGRVKGTRRTGSSTPGTYRRSRRTTAQFETLSVLLQAAERLQRGFAELLRTHDLSAAQYNVLRVLRGAGDAGITCGNLGSRLIRHDPDITRLLDRLERRGLIERAREVEDRRIVRTRIGAEGLALLATLDEPVDRLHEQQFGHLSEARLAELRAMLEEAQAGLP